MISRVDHLSTFILKMLIACMIRIRYLTGSSYFSLANYIIITIQVIVTIVIFAGYHVVTLSFFLAKMSL